MFKRISVALLLTFATFSVVLAVAPGPPQNLAASVSGNTVTLYWTAPSTGDAPSSYVVEAAPSPGGAAIASLPVAARSVVVPNVPNGTYYIRVRGVNGDGSSASSNEVIVVVPGGGSTPGPGGCSSPPNAPQNLTGSAVGNVLSLNWSPSASGCPATAFAVHAGSAPGQSNITVANVGGATSLSAGAPTGNYYIRVVALNAFGGSVASNEVRVAVATPCAAPTTPPMLLNPTTSGSTVSLTWVPAGGDVTSYVVEGGSSSGATNILNTMTTATSYTWSNAPAGTHYIRVRPVNSCGTGPASNQVTATVASTTPPPTSRVRIGAICRDGWTSTATGSGACSSHGGVSCWRYSDGTCTNP